MASTQFQLHRDNYGRLVFTDKNGLCHEGVVPVCAFPIAAPAEGLSLISTDGHEVAWIESLSELPADLQALLREELASRDFVPEIRRIVAVSSFACPSTWQLETDRGNSELILKGEEDIRRLSPTRLLIADSHGIQFLVRDLTALDRHSRKLLDRFL